jgi:hypothetical protein
MTKHHPSTGLLYLGELSLISSSNLLPPRPLQLRQRINPLLQLRPVQHSSVGVIFFKLGLPVVERDKLPAASGVDVHVGFELPWAVESAGDEIRDQSAGIGVVAPEVAAAERALGDCLADFRLGREGDEDRIVYFMIVGSTVVVCWKSDSRGGGGVG